MNSEAGSDMLGRAMSRGTRIDRGVPKDEKRRCPSVGTMARYCRVALVCTLCSCFLAASALADGVDAVGQSITIALTQEPPNLDATRSTDLVSFFIIAHVNEGLLRYDRGGRLVPGVAASWQNEGRRMTFHLKETARWSDGLPVVASDFVYGLRLVANPAHGSPYIAIMQPLRNAAKIRQGQLPPTALGVTAPDNRTVVIDLEEPCGYCPSLMSHGAFFPVNEAFHRGQGERYGAEPEHLLYNGPFELTRWTHGASLTLQKNADYWDAGAIRLREINIGYITEDNRTRLNLFQDGRIALARLGAETVREAVAQKLKVRTFRSGGLAYLTFNLRPGHPTADARLRKAVQMVFDPEEFVNRVIGIPGYVPAYSFFPAWINGASGKFQDEHPPARIPRDVGAARALVAAVRAEAGGNVPELTLITTTSVTGNRIAEYLQGIIKRHLGLEVKVDQQIFKQYLAKARDGEFDIALSSWYPDFDDIVTYADLLGSTNPNNRSRYESRPYDQALEVVVTSIDPTSRMRAAAELQALLIRDVPVLPMAETGSAYVQHRRLRGVVRRVMGADPDYTYAWVVP